MGFGATPHTVRPRVIGQGEEREIELKTFDCNCYLCRGAANVGIFDTFLTRSDGVKISTLWY
jgi:hypothetical protein